MQLEENETTDFENTLRSENLNFFNEPDIVNNEDILPSEDLHSSDGPNFEDDEDNFSEGTLDSNVSVITVDDLADANGPVEPEGIQDKLPEGRRIADLGFFFLEMHRTFDNHSNDDACKFRHWRLIDFYYSGLKTQMSFKCQNCNYKCSIWSEPKSDEILDINRAAVVGTIVVGIGHYQLEELFASMNMTCMVTNTYIKYREEVIVNFKDAAFKSMRKAGQEEVIEAFNRNDVINGVACTDVVTDGSWAKRSYKHSYDSLSGVGAIIGNYTGKVLDVGIRNKYCSFCDFYERKNLPCKPHACYKNYDRNASSSKMETDAIASGFTRSIEMHQLIYKRIIADNDSSVYKTIMDRNPYSEYDVSVEKVDCSNHLMRNFCNKLRDLAAATDPNFFRNSEFKGAREIIKGKIETLRKEIITAAKLRNSEDVSHAEKTENLRRDIIDIPYHVFGEHEKCQSHNWSCQLESAENETNNVTVLQRFGLFEKLITLVSDLSSRSRSLVLLLTNNYAEGFNSIICQFIGGKRIQLGSKGSYDARVYGSVLQQNSQQVLVDIYESMNKQVPNVILKMHQQRQKIVQRNKEYRRENGQRAHNTRIRRTDPDYGLRCQQPDKTSQEMAELKDSLMARLRNNADNWQTVEIDTRDQSQSRLWHVLRKRMLTASNFGEVCRRKSTTSVQNIVKKILHYSVIQTTAMKYGLLNEDKARQEVSILEGEEIIKCGLFVDQEHPFLGASPDGLVGEDGTFEAKCLFKMRDMTVDEAIEKFPNDVGKIFDPNDLNKMRTTHHFYYQVQGQLHITNRQYCLFTLWTPSSIKIIRVERDDKFWDDKMKGELVSFYHNCLCPEIIDSRYNRNMPIRELHETVNESTPELSNNMQVDENETTTQNDEIQSSAIANHSTDPVQRRGDNWYDFYSNEQLVWTNESLEARRAYLDHQVASLEAVTRTVLDDTLDFPDAVIDTFLKLVRDTTPFKTQSNQYVIYRDIAEPLVSDESLQIIGGGTRHWRCLYFDTEKLYVYDSIKHYRSLDEIADIEKEYIRIRFPTIEEKDIVFGNVQEQHDNINCGVFASAFVTSVVLGENPVNRHYCEDMMVLRRHFLNIIERKKLLSFP